MPAKSGRKMLVKKGSAVIAGVRAKTISWSGEAIDISSDDDAGFRTFLTGEEGQEQIDISVEGVWKDAVLRDIAFTPATGKMLTDITLEDTVTGMLISGNFKLASYEESAPYNESTTFSASLQSSGSWTHTPGV